MLEEAMQFVEPDGEPFTMVLLGHSADGAEHLKHRFAEMLVERGYQIDVKPWKIVVGQTQILFRSARLMERIPYPQSWVTFEDHACLDPCLCPGYARSFPLLTPAPMPLE